MQGHFEIKPSAEKVLATVSRPNKGSGRWVRIHNHGSIPFEARCDSSEYRIEPDETFDVFGNELKVRNSYHRDGEIAVGTYSEC